MLKVFVVDDHETVRIGLEALFDEEPDIVVVGSAATGADGFEGIARTEPDVAIIDLRLPDTDGIELVREVRSLHPSTRCLIFTAHESEEAELEAVVAGASGYLLKGQNADDLVAAVHAAGSGGSLIDSATVERALQTARKVTSHPERTLSPQQAKVLALIVEGLTNREIAGRLALAEKTVKNYVSVILDKLSVSTRTAAAIYVDRVRRRDENPDEPG